MKDTRRKMTPEIKNQIRLISREAYTGNRVTQQLALEYALTKLIEVVIEPMANSLMKVLEDGKENDGISQSAKVGKERRPNGNAQGDAQNV